MSVNTFRERPLQRGCHSDTSFDSTGCRLQAPGPPRRLRPGVATVPQRPIDPSVGMAGFCLTAPALHLDRTLMNPVNLLVALFGWPLVPRELVAATATGGPLTRVALSLRNALRKNHA